MQPSNRPISPHLQVYRPQLTSVLSITHRGTGVVLAVAAVLFAYWLAALAAGPQAYATAQGFFGSWLGQLILFGGSFCLFYHLCNGIRHLIWDVGLGFEIEQVYKSGRIVVFAAAAMTVLAWIIALAAGD